MQSTYSASSLYMFRVSATPIIRSTQNCNYSLRYWLYFFFVQLPPSNVAKLATLEGGCCIHYVKRCENVCLLL